MSAWWSLSALVLVCWSMSAESETRRRPRSAILWHDDRDAALRPDDVLHEEGDLAHHRPPAGLVPADRAVVERRRADGRSSACRSRCRREPGADAVHAHRLGAGHLAHDVDVVHAAVDDRAQRRPSGSCASSRPGPRLCWLRFMRMTSGLPSVRADLDELRPGRVHAQDVAEDQLAVRRPAPCRRSPAPRPRWSRAASP